MNLGTGQGGVGGAGFGGFGSAFGSTASTLGSTTALGAPSAAPSFGATTTTFGGPNPPAPTTAFGSTVSAPSTFGATSGFGRSSSAAFGASSTLGATTGFGASAAPSVFGTSTSFGAAPTTAFGVAATQPAAAPSGSGFGGLTTFGQSSFGGIGGGTAPTAPFGTTTTTFGGSAAPSAGFGGAPTTSFGSSGGAFGSAPAATAVFGSAQPTAFGNAAAAPTTTFGSTPAATPFGSAAPTTAFGSTANTFGGPKAAPTTTFGGTSTPFGSAAPTPFGTSAPTSFGSAAPTTTFGSSSAPTSFGGGAPASFGSAAPTTTTFGSSAPATTTFGSTTTFGKPAPTTTATFGGSGAPAFGSTSSAPTTVFGSSGTSAPTTTFGSASSSTTVFGSSSSAPTTTFGSSSAPTTTFGSTASAPKTTFGSSSSSAPTTTFGSMGASAPTTTFGSSSSTTFGSSSSAPTTTFGKPTSSFGGGAPKSTSFGGASSAPFGRTSPAPTFGSGSSSSSAPPAPTPFGRPSTSAGKAPSSSPPPPTSLLDNKPLSSGTGRGKQVRPPRQLPAAASLKTAAPLPSPDASPTHESAKHHRASIARSTAPPPPPADDADFANDVEKFDLSTAVTIDGLCVDMCSPKERDEQMRCDDLSTFEKGTPPDAFIVKRYQRSAADHKLDIPSEIRPLGVLRRTQLYLEQNIIDLDKSGPDSRFNPPRVPDILDLYNFFWNRARMIRNDFTLQNYRGGGRHHVIAMDVHERIARFFILCEHELIENPKFIEQQNMEQLGKTMKSLQDFYDDARLHGAETSPFEAEFAGYFILLHLDKDKASAVLKFTKRLPPSLLNSSFVQFAMAAFVARHTNDYVTFFRLVKDATLLQACLLHRYFPTARSDALACMNRVYRHPYPLETLTTLLCFDSPDHAAAICDLHGLPTSADGASIVMGTDSFETIADLRATNVKIPATCSDMYVSAKQQDWLRGDVCRGVTEYEEGAYPLLPRTIHTTEMEERQRLYPTRPPYDDPFSKFHSSDATPATTRKVPATTKTTRKDPIKTTPIQPPLPPATPSRAAAAPPLPGQPPLPPTPPTTVFGNQTIFGAAPPPQLGPSLSEIEARQRQLRDEKQRLLDEIAKRQSSKVPPGETSSVPSTPPRDTAKLVPLKPTPVKAATPPSVPRVTFATPPATPSKADEAETKAAEEAAAKAAADAAAAKQKAAKAAAEKAAAAAEEARRVAEAKKQRDEQLQRERERNEQRARELQQREEQIRLEKEAAERKAHDIQALGEKWLAINFEAHDDVVARKETLVAQERQALARVQRLAVQKLRFAMWRRFVQRQQLPRLPGNAVFEPPVARPASARFGNAIESLLCNAPRAVPPPWTRKDAAVTEASNETIVALQRQLHAHIDVATLLAPGLCRRHPAEPTIEYSIGFLSIEDANAPAAISPGVDVTPWLAVKCGLATPLEIVVHRVQDKFTNRTFLLHLSAFPTPRVPSAVLTAVAFHSADQVGPWVHQVVNAVVGAAKKAPSPAPMDVHLLALTTLPAQEVEAAAKTELAALPSYVQVTWHVGSWDTSHATVKALVEHMGAEAKLHPVRHTLVSLRDTIDDVMRITLHQSSALTTHFADVVLHLHAALSLLHRLIDASVRADPSKDSSSALGVMEAFLQAIPAPPTATQSTLGWIQSLPTLAPSERDLAVHLVDAAWQQTREDDDASPAKTIVSIVLAIVLNGIPGMDDAVVALPKTWVVECRQLMQSIATDKTHSFPTKMPTKRRAEDELTTNALVSMMLQSKKRHTPAPPTTGNGRPMKTRQAYHAKWKRDAARTRVMHALTREKAAHAAFCDVLQAALES